ncbi:hypothetical protein ES703_57337 [subsurface metagenome]
MDGDYRLGSGGNFGFNLLWVQVISPGVNIDKYRGGITLGYGFSGGNEGEGGSDYLVTGLNPAGKQGKVKGIGAGGNPHGKPGAAVSCHLFFKSSNLGTKDKLSLLHHPLNSRINLLFY